MLPSRWSHLVRHGLLGTTLLAAASSGTARAEDCDDVADRTIAFVIGVQVSPNTKFIGGIEARKCLSHNTEALVRLELGGGSPRLIGGARARPFEEKYDENDFELFGAEGGLAIDMKSRWGLHLAGTYGTHSAYAAVQGLVSLGGEPAQPARTSIALGFSPWTAFGPTYVEGRPIVSHGEMLRPRILGKLASVKGAEAREVRDHFVSSAQLELSSVWTFLRLAAELAAAGAPPHLIAAALDAADDEVRHAELCAGAAGGLTLAALPMQIAHPRFTQPSQSALAMLAAEAWCEGCLNETAAAEEARLASESAQGEIKRSLATIARDESRHAELSWGVLAWIHSIAPDVVVTALESIPATHASEDDAIDAALARFGVPTREVKGAARSHAASTAYARLRDFTS